MLLTCLSDNAVVVFELDILKLLAFRFTFDCQALKALRIGDCDGLQMIFNPLRLNPNAFNLL